MSSSSSSSSTSKDRENNSGSREPTATAKPAQHVFADDDDADHSDDDVGHEEHEQSGLLSPSAARAAPSLTSSSITSSSSSSSASPSTAPTAPSIKPALIVSTALVLVMIVAGYFSTQSVNNWLSSLPEGGAEKNGTTSSSPSPSALPSTSASTPSPSPSPPSPTQSPSYISTPVGVVASSPADEREFSWIVLPSGMEVFLVRDEAATQAAAAVDVSVGSLHDPKEFAGLAHFLEHMLFLGSRSFPSENEYNSFLSAHGGSSNAYTDLEHTNYYFNIDASALEGGLERFAPFFISPLFNASSTQREMRAVDSEHKKNLNSDGWRMYQLLKESSSPTSPFHAFSTGDLTTLDREGVRPALLAFHGLHYTAAKMRGCIIGREKIEVLRGWAEQYFGPIAPTAVLAEGVEQAIAAAAAAAARDTSKIEGIYPLLSVTPSELELAVSRVSTARDRVRDSLSSDLAFPPSPAGLYRNRLLTYKPVESGHSLELMWPLWPVSDASVQLVPGAGFVGGLLGDESEGGLLPFLRSRGLAEGVSGGLEVSTKGFSMVQVTIQLSPLAISNVSASADMAFVKVIADAAADAAAAASAGANISNSSSSSSSTPEEDVAASSAAVEAAALAASQAAAAAAMSNLVVSITEAIYVYLDALDEKLTASVAYGVRELGKSGITSSSLLGMEEEISAPRSRAGRAGEGAGVGGAVVSGVPSLTRDGDGKLISWPASEDDVVFRTWKESVAVSEVTFRFPQSGDSSSMASSFSRSMHTSTPQQILGSPSTVAWQPLHALRVVRAMTPSNVVGMLSSSLLPLPPLFAHTLVEPVYSTPYGSVPFESIVTAASLSPLQSGGIDFSLSLTELQSSLHLPLPNPFIPTDLSLLPHQATYREELGIPEKPTRRSGDAELNITSAQVWSASRVRPVLLRLESGLKQIYYTTLQSAYQHYQLPFPPQSSSPSPDGSSSGVLDDGAPTTYTWWAPDVFFSWPRTCISIDLLSMRARDSPSASILTYLFTASAMEAANMDLYQLAKGSGSASISAASFGPGIGLSIHVYTSVVDTVVRDLLPRLLHPTTTTLDPQRVAAHLSLFVEGMHNSIFEQPVRRAASHYNRLIGAARFSEEELFRAAADIAGVSLDTVMAAGGGGGGDAPTPLVVPNPALTAERVAQHIQAVFADVSSVQTVITGNENLEHATTVVVDALSHVFAEVAEARAKAGGTRPAAVPDAVGNAFAKYATVPSGSYMYQSNASNPADPNSAVYAVYELGLRDGCEGETRVAAALPSPNWEVVVASEGRMERREEEGGEVEVSSSRAAAATAAAAATGDIDISSWSCARRAATFEVLANLIHEPTFSELRTQQQLGYIVSARGKAGLVVGGDPGDAWTTITASVETATSLCEAAEAQQQLQQRVCVPIRSVQNSPLGWTASSTSSVQLPVQSDAMLGLLVAVQGTAQPAHVQDERAATFFAIGLGKFLEELPDGEILSAVEALRAQRVRSPSSPEEVHGWIASEISSRTYRFNRDEETNEDLGAVQPEDVRALYKHIVLVEKKRVAVEVVGAGSVAGVPTGDAQAVRVRMKGA